MEERKPPPTGVASGPFRARRVLRMLSIVAFGSGSPAAATPAIPAFCSSHTKGAPTAWRMASVASLTSGPMPSPGMSVAGMLCGAVGIVSLSCGRNPELYEL